MPSVQSRKVMVRVFDLQSDSALENYTAFKIVQPCAMMAKDDDLLLRFRESAEFCRSPINSGRDEEDSGRLSGCSRPF